MTLHPSFGFQAAAHFLYPLTRAVAAIDCDRLTGYEGSEIGREINREFAHFLKPAGARDRMHSSLRFKCRFGIILELRNLDRQGRFDIARTNGFDPYCLIRKVEG